jgi:hypothetical protein
MDSLPRLDAVFFSGQARGNQAAIFLYGEDQYSSARLPLSSGEAQVYASGLPLSDSARRPGQLGMR